MDREVAENTTEDAFFGGTLRLFQPRRGHRIGTDAVLLAASCPPGARAIVDLGCGVGAVGLRAAQTNPGAQLRLIDRDAAMLALAEGNIDANGLADRCRILCADVFARQTLNPGFAGDPGADVVLTNPPFDEPGRVRVSPVTARAGAHVMEGTLAGWLVAARKLLRPSGRLIVIHRADALDRLLAGMQGRFGALAIRPVHPRAGEAASRILVSAVAGSRGPLRLLPPLVLHGEGGAFTPEAEAIHRGKASLSWE